MRPQGWFSEIEGKELQRIVKSLPVNGIIIEIGTWCGLSASYISEVLTEGQVLITIDNYLENSEASKHTSTKPQEARLQFLDFFFQEKLFKKKIFPIYGSSAEIAGLFKKSSMNIDFLFIDGDHGYNSVKTDYMLWSAFNPRYVAFHDYNNCGDDVTRFVNEIKNNYKNFKLAGAVAVLEN